MDTAKKFLLFDSRIYSDLDKYIWISDSYKEHREAQRFFVCLLKKGVYVKGFATNKKSLFNLKMYNKKIYDINVLSRENTIVFYDTYLGRFDVELPDDVHNARVLNSELSRGKVIIWGSGITGRRALKILSENGLKIQCFIDSNKDLEGTYKYGIPVYAPEYLEKFEECPTIIEAMENWEELDVCIKGVFANRFYFSFVENDEKKMDYKSHYINKMFNLETWLGNFAFFVGKKVYVYGTGIVESRIPECLKLLDICFGGFLIDTPDMEDNDAIISYDVKYIDEILNEKNYFIWVYDKKKVKRLDELGFVSYKNYICYQGGNYIPLNRKQILDVNLGNNYLADSKYPGFTVYGADKEKDFRIMVLGNSTTDGKLYSFKSWPELMYEELCTKGIKDITVYNGGVYAYTSGQELLKLIRDVLPLKPDMIIAYDGYCDLIMYFSYPLSNGYLNKVFELAGENIQNGEDEVSFSDKTIFTYYGIEAKKDMFEMWLSNTRTMYAIASERNISFYSFCQPMLSSKKGKTEKEKNMLLSMYNPEIVNLMNGSFRKRMNQIRDKQPDYMHDLSHIFDDEKDVYMDQCHVWEKGNRIIAREITQIILPELRCV